MGIVSCSSLDFVIPENSKTLPEIKALQGPAAYAEFQLKPWT